ncbi:MAG: LeuD/DmdB family oxidoreductase small subunit [Candidatus Thorarchaeota archaeon SMTZ1-83]
MFDDDINTDLIIQGRHLTMLDYSEMAKHTFEILRPEFAKEVKPDDIVIAGRNFGGGSSREEAPAVLKTLGIGCVVAESFARIFYRNGFNIGLPLMVVPDISSDIEDGQLVTIDFTEGTLTIDHSRVLSGEPLPALMQEMLEAGGAVQMYLKRK